MSVRFWRLAAIGAAIAGWALMFAWTVWAILLFPFAGFLWWLGSRVRRSDQATLRGLLYQIPEYEDLLDRFPDADILREGT
jgi:hypothetical protein